MSSSSGNKEPQNSDNAADKKPEQPTTFGAFKQAVVDTGNAILCKTVLSPDSERCKKRAQTLSGADATTAKTNPNGDCRCGEPPQQPKKKKSTNSLNPTSTSPDKTLEFIKFFNDDGR